MDVEHIMTTELVTVSPHATVGDALHLIEELEVRHLPVVVEGRLVGLVADRDLREYRLPPPEEHARPKFAERLLSTRISEVMRTELVTLEPGESLGTAVDLMLEYGIGAVPVVDDKHTILGIVSYVDILKAVRDVL